jgi:outer membrane protein assembly factor BamB
MRTLLFTVACIAGASVFSGCAGPGVTSSGASQTPLFDARGRIQPREKSAGFNKPGNIIIADQFNNRVIEIDPKSHAVVWQFGDGSNVPGPHSIVAVNDVERVGSFTLMAGTGAPSGTEPGCGGQEGCPDNRVILVNRDGQIVWQYGMAGVTGAGSNQLNAPVHSLILPNRHVFITDQGNQRVIEVTRAKKIVWQYGMTGVSGDGANQLNDPNSAELLENGHILIADEGNNRVIEIEKISKKIVWQYPAQTNTALLNGPAFASRLRNGHTLISDASNNRIIEVDASGNVASNFATNARPGSNTSPIPTRAVRLADGDTLISDQFNHQVIEIDSHIPANIVFSQGMLNAAGNGFNELNAPYDAKVVGDFTGLTPPFGHGFDREDASFTTLLND